MFVNGARSVALIGLRSYARVDLDRTSAVLKESPSSLGL